MNVSIGDQEMGRLAEEEEEKKRIESDREGE